MPQTLAGAAPAIFGIMEATSRANNGELVLIVTQDEIARPSRKFPVERVA